MTGARDGLTINEERPDQADVMVLMAASDTYHERLYPAESNHLVGLEAFTGRHATFLVARLDGRVVGCGGLLKDARGWGELKRMWVDPEVRGHGVGRALLARLEMAAVVRGIDLLRLETGVRQSAALGLYDAAGFMRRGPFGDYAEDPLSVFMEKRVSVPDT